MGPATTTTSINIYAPPPPYRELVSRTRRVKTHKVQYLPDIRLLRRDRFRKYSVGALHCLATKLSHRDLYITFLQKNW